MQVLFFGNELWSSVSWELIIQVLSLVIILLVILDAGTTDRHHTNSETAALFLIVALELVIAVNAIGEVYFAVCGAKLAVDGIKLGRHVRNA